MNHRFHILSYVWWVDHPVMMALEVVESRCSAIGMVLVGAFGGFCLGVGVRLFFV